MRKLTILLLTTLLLYGCSHERWMIKHKDYACKFLNCPNIIDTNIVYKDTTIEFSGETFVELDTASLNLIFKCDSLNNVYVTEIDKQNGKRLTLTYLLENNRLSLKAKSDSLEIVWKMYKEIKGSKQTVYIDREVPVKVTEYRSYWWHWAIDGALLMLAIVAFLKPKRKI